MKNILITGANSYIGTSFEKWLSQWPDKYIVDTLDMTIPGWKDNSFEHYDVVFHVAGIAHQKETEDNKSLYYKVNRDLSVSVAKKAKEDGVKHFIILSSMSVYGMSTGIITENSNPSPVTYYGDSKLQADESIFSMNQSSFKVSIVRPPMVYGNGCKGNYNQLAWFAKKSVFFPDTHNRRSMIYIDHLTEFIRLLIESNMTGVFFPQNKDFVNSYNMVKNISDVNKHIMLKLRGFNWLIYICSKRFNCLNKVFGTLIYDINDRFDYDYSIMDFESTIRATEGK